MLIENTFIYLIGFAGTGKLTIAKEIQKQLPAILVDNHLILNVIFSLIDPDGITPLPPKVWENATKVRNIVLDTVRDLSKPNRNFIFTNQLVENCAEDQQLYDEIAILARDRGAKLLPVRLLISTDELCTRVVSADRVAKMKSIDPISARELSTKHVLLKPAGGYFDLEITSLSAEQSAKIIIDEVRRNTGA